MGDGSGVGFFYFHVCNFLGSFTLQGGGGGVGVWGFFIRLITSPYWALHSLKGYQRNCE
jgi:hypothetical protein